MQRTEKNDRYIRFVCCRSICLSMLPTMMLFLLQFGTQITSIVPRCKNTWMNASPRWWFVEDQVHPGGTGQKSSDGRVETLTMFARNTRHRHLLRTCSRTVFLLLSRRRWYSNFRLQLLHKSLSQLRQETHSNPKSARRLDGIIGILMKLSSRQTSTIYFINILSVLNQKLYASKNTMYICIDIDVL